MIRQRINAARAAAYDRRQRGHVVHALDEFAPDREPPPGYGAKANERVVEIPWLLALRPTGRVLDAGSSLNHREYLDRIQPLVDELHIVTLAYEGTAYPDRGVSYAFADLRALPYRDDYFDTVVSISTLEHVGMDNTGYGSGVRAAADPLAETDCAVRELARVLRKPGRLLVSVPYGRRENHGTFRQFDREDVARLVAAAGPHDDRIVVYRSGSDGWKLSDLDGAADASYRVGFAAEAVVCLELSF